MRCSSPPLILEPHIISLHFRFGVPTSFLYFATATSSIAAYPWISSCSLGMAKTIDRSAPNAAYESFSVLREASRQQSLRQMAEMDRRAEISEAYHNTSPRSPDTASPIYPLRAIRPLPKSRLKSKLSPEQASTLVFPPDPPPISPTLSFGAQEMGTPDQQPRLTNGHSSHHHDHHHDHHDHHHPSAHSLCTCGEEGDSGDDEVEFDHPDYRYSTAPGANGVPVKPADSLQRRLVEASRSASKPPPPGSTASSADGYESFENTSNKKKRKIPLSATSSMHQSQLSAEMASMGISNGVGSGGSDENNHHAQQQQQGSPQATSGSSPGSGTGISGAGRGRYGRQDARNRRPLGSNTMNVINGYNSRAPARDVKGGEDSGIENTGGIISQAIKTAAEQGPITPAGKGRENQATAAAAYATGTPSQQRGGLPAKGASTQTTPPLRGQQTHNGGRPPPPPAHNAPAANQHQQAPPPKPRPRRSPSKEYALQASTRKKNQQYQNYHHPPKPEDMWICEFCEYEDIYGAPPYAMIRKYEIKDRQEYKKAAEKRRLLEKAKMKGRKNKKGSGKGSKNNAAATNANNTNSGNGTHLQQDYDPNDLPPDGEEFYDDDEDYADEYEPVGPGDHYSNDYPPPAPVGTPVAPVGGGSRGHG
ncbi:unnamed protein product [Zymoseptoria tritici ST99CH_3D7]|uniref:Protein IBD2 n=1 Tax=Zymoseptoria tritici (strain ST99CH_3D7) TaxID=1276538 RepID=A0A1X7RMU1_ZYMT9|nr:unnamed protein product [Zymoseptoria tritici ST99CH_3D7]